MHLATPDEVSWQASYIVGATVLSGLPVADLITAAEKVQEIRPIDGVICWDEAHALTAARVAEALGLPGLGAEAVAACRDKFTTRERLSAAGVGQPEFRVVSSADEAVIAATTIGYPVVLKPRAAAASLGVVRVNDEGELRAAFNDSARARISTSASFDASVLVEQFLDAQEISVDSVVYGGDAQPKIIAWKSVGFEPYFEETGHMVRGKEPLLKDPNFLSFIKEVHRALGLQWGWTHIEVKLTAAGPKVIEVNPRIGGGLIARLGAYATGVDAADLAADAALARRRPSSDVEPWIAGVVANRFYYAAAPIFKVSRIGFDDALLPEGVRERVTLVEPGDTVIHPPEGLLIGRVALAVVEAEDESAAIELLDQCRDALILEGSSSSAS